MSSPPSNKPSKEPNKCFGQKTYFGGNRGRSNYRSFNRYKEFSPVELQNQIRREKREVPALRHDYSNHGIEKALGLRNGQVKPSGKEQVIVKPVPNREIRSLYFQVNENDYKRVGQDMEKKVKATASAPPETSPKPTEVVDGGKASENTSDTKENVKETTPAPGILTTRKNPNAPNQTEVYLGNQRIRNAAILGLLKKAETNGQDKPSNVC